MASLEGCLSGNQLCRGFAHEALEGFGQVWLIEVAGFKDRIEDWDALLQERCCPLCPCDLLNVILAESGGVQETVAHGA